MRGWVPRAGLLVCLLAARGGAADETEKPDGAALVVGKWEVVKSGGEPPVGFTMEYTKESRFTFTAPRKAGKQLVIEGGYRVEGDKLRITAKKGDREDPPATLTIKKLTARQLVLQGGSNVAELKRIK